MNKVPGSSLARAAFLLGAVALALEGHVAWSQNPAPEQTPAPQDSLTITGDIPAPLTLRVDDLQKMPQQQVTQTDQDGTSTQYTGVLLRTILEKAGAPAGRQLRGKGLASYIVAKARDNYQVVFTPAEMDPTLGNEQILVAYLQNGKPLFGYQGPFRILCPNDRAGARSLRMLTTIEVVRLVK